MAKNFIKPAIRHPGRLTSAAKKAGESISRYAKEHEHDPQGTIGDAARLYQNVLRPAARTNSTPQTKPNHAPPKRGGHWSGR